MVSAGLELPEYKARPLNLSALLPPGCIINVKASDQLLGGCGGLQLSLRPASSGLEALGKTPPLLPFPICQVKVAPANLQGPASAKSVIFRRGAQSQAPEACSWERRGMGDSSASDPGLIRREMQVGVGVA